MLQQYKNSLERNLKEKLTYSALSEAFPSKEGSLVVRSETKQLNYRQTDLTQNSILTGHTQRKSRTRVNPRK